MRSGTSAGRVPGYIEMLDDVARALEREKLELGLADVTPELLEAAKASLVHLHAVEDVAHAVYRSVYEERLTVDDSAMGMMLKVARRVGSHSEDDPQLLTRWKFLRDFMALFHRGGGHSGGRGGRGSQAAAAEKPVDRTPAEG